MNESTTMPAEQAAEHRTNITGWVCKTCRRYYGEDERAARYCCAIDFKCSAEGCEARVPKGGYTICDACHAKKDKKRWLALPEVAWDGVTPLVLHDDDRYFFDESDLCDYLEEEEGRRLKDLRFVICVPVPHPRFDVNDFLGDSLPEDGEVDGKDIEKIVNDWIEANAPKTWEAGKTRPTLASLAHLADSESP